MKTLISAVIVIMLFAGVLAPPALAQDEETTLPSTRRLPRSALAVALIGPAWSV